MRWIVEFLLWNLKHKSFLLLVARLKPVWFMFFETLWQLIEAWDLILLFKFCSCAKSQINRPINQKAYSSSKVQKPLFSNPCSTGDPRGKLSGLVKSSQFQASSRSFARIFVGRSQWRKQNKCDCECDMRVVRGEDARSAEGLWLCISRSNAQDLPPACCVPLCVLP